MLAKGFRALRDILGREWSKWVISDGGELLRSIEDQIAEQRYVLRVEVLSNCIGKRRLPRQVELLGGGVAGRSRGGAIY